MSKGFEVELTGEYVARSGVMGKERIVKNYKIKCVVPSSEAVLSVIKNKILGKQLKKEYDDYVLFRTYHIMSINPLSEEDRFNADLGNIRYMGRDQLIQLVKTNALGVPYQLYPDLFKLREAVLFASNDANGYAKHLDIHRADLELDVEVAKLNPALQEEESETYAPSTPNPNGKLAPAKKAKKKKDLSAGAIAKKTDDRIAGLEGEMKKTGELGELDEAEEAAVKDDADINDI